MEVILHHCSHNRQFHEPLSALLCQNLVSRKKKKINVLGHFLLVFDSDEVVEDIDRIVDGEGGGEPAAAAKADLVADP